MYGVDKIENGKLWYYGVDIENECYVYKSEETTVMDQVLFDGITEIIDAVGRKVVYTKDGLILSSGEKIVFVEEMIFPSKNKYDLPTSEVVCTFRGEECQVKKGVAKYLDANEIASRGLRLEIKKNIILRILAYATLPSFTPATIDLKLSSIIIILAVSLAISVPLPIAIPILAVLSAGASLTPSPVTATNSPILFKDSTISNF